MRHEEPVKWTRGAAGSSLCRETREQKGGGCRADGQTGELVCRQTEAAGRGRPWFPRIPCTRPASKEDPQPDQGGKPFSEGLGPRGRTRSMADGGVSSARGGCLHTIPSLKANLVPQGAPTAMSHCHLQTATPLKSPCASGRHTQPGCETLNPVWGLNGQ